MSDDATPQPTQAVVAQIAGAVDGVTPEQIQSVIAAWNAARDGEPLGTVRRDPATGQVAHRVNADGLHLWKVTAPDGGQWADQSPTLPTWDSIYTPS